MNAERTLWLGNRNSRSNQESVRRYRLVVRFGPKAANPSRQIAATLEQHAADPGGPL